MTYGVDSLSIYPDYLLASRGNPGFTNRGPIIEDPDLVCGNPVAFKNSAEFPASVITAANAENLARFF